MRYFIVFYEAHFTLNKLDSFTKLKFGKMCIYSSEYPNEKKTEEFIAQQIKEESAFVEVQITNIIELNETDFNNFIK